MYFMSATAPITLHTDTSDYGVGGYLFRMVDGVSQPIFIQLIYSIQAIVDRSAMHPLDQKLKILSVILLDQ